MKQNKSNQKINIFRKLHLTILDYVLIFLVATAALIFFFYFFRKYEMINIRVKVTDRDVLYAQNNPSSWFANRFQVGDVEKNALGKIVAEIVEVESFDVSKPPEKYLGQYSSFNTFPQKVVYIDIKTKALYNSRTKTYSIKAKQLAFGVPVRFTFSNIQFDGLVTEVNSIQNFYKTEKKLVKAKLLEASRAYSDVYGVLPEIAAAVQEEDAIYDSNGNTLAVVKEVNTSPAKRTVITSSGQTKVVLDPVLKDVTYIIELTAKVFQNESYVFDDIPVKIGAILPLNFDHISVFPTITELLDEKPQ